MTVIGLDFASATLAEADHLARDLRARFGFGEAAVICTHLTETTTHTWRFRSTSSGTRMR